MSLIEAIRGWQLLTCHVLYLSSISLQSRAPKPLETPVMLNAINLCAVIQFAQHSYSCAYITLLRADCEAPPPYTSLRVFVSMFLSADLPFPIPTSSPAGSSGQRDPVTFDLSCVESLGYKL